MKLTEIIISLFYNHLFFVTKVNLKLIMIDKGLIRIYLNTVLVHKILNRNLWINRVFVDVVESWVDCFLRVCGEA